jgi:RNA polymerase sigma factor (sigma-70 family)
MEENDAAILNAVAAGDKQRAAVLFCRHVMPAVRSHVLVLLKQRESDAEDDANDVSQDTALEVLASIEAERFLGRSSLKTYAIEIARRMVFRRRRSFWFKWVTSLLEPGKDADAPVSSGRAAPWGDADPERLARAMIEHLEPRERVLFSMRLDRKETAEIAASLGINESHVRTIESRTVAKLRTLFTRYEDGKLVLAGDKLQAKPSGRRGRKG